MRPIGSLWRSTSEDLANKIFIYVGTGCFVEQQSARAHFITVLLNSEIDSLVPIDIYAVG